jgi:hypothetical protein
MDPRGNVMNQEPVAGVRSVGPLGQVITPAAQNDLIGPVRYGMHRPLRPGPSPREADLDEADARELLRYRCSIRTDLGPDQWPFNETYVEDSATGHH